MLILVVDDEEAIREEMAELLSRKGATVVTASSGEAALNVVAQGHDVFDVVVTDMSMGGMSGAELIRALHEMDFKEAKYVLASGHQGNYAGELALLGIPCTVLTKPLDPRQLLSAVALGSDSGR